MRHDQRHAPYFFLSYAHTPRYDTSVRDPDLWVGRLYRDLCDHVVALTDHPPGHPVGFVDREMRSGEDWPETLAQNLATARVFVPLFSPRYFTRPQCGREWFAFAQRAHQHHARGHTAELPAAQAIVPALWVPVEPGELPGVAARLQYDHPEFGESYNSEGLYGLIKLKLYRAEYERAVYELAKRIVNVARRSALPPGEPVTYEEVDSAFGHAERRGPRTMQLTVVADSRAGRPEGRRADYYGASALDWNPYHPDCVVPLAQYTEEVLQTLDYVTTSTSFDEEPDPAGPGTTPPTSPELILLDRWALRDAPRRERLARADTQRPWAGLMVPWNHTDPDGATAKDLTHRLDATLPTRTSQGRAACRSAVNGIHTLRDFTAVLPKMVEWSFAQYLKHAKPHPPAGPAQERPRLTGPVPEPPTDDAEVT